MDQEVPGFPGRVNQDQEVPGFPGRVDQDVPGFPSRVDQDVPGCPGQVNQDVPGCASGNVASEDVLYMLDRRVRIRGRHPGASVGRIRHPNGKGVALASAIV